MLQSKAIVVSLADHAAIPGLMNTHHHMPEEVNANPLYGQHPQTRKIPGLM